MAWEYFTSTKYDDTIREAVKLGWKEKKVQVRVEFRGEEAHYFIEPWEKDCECRHILKYSEHVK